MEEQLKELLDILEETDRKYISECIDIDQTVIKFVLDEIKKAQITKDRKLVEKIENYTEWATQWIQDMRNDYMWLLQKSLFNKIKVTTQKIQGSFTKEGFEKQQKKFLEDVQRKSEEYARLNKDE